MLSRNELPKMKCGHDVYDYELEKSSGIVFIQWRCVEGCKTEWTTVGEAPYPDECKLDESSKEMMEIIKAREEKSVEQQ
nr:hypothetical protein [Candidatus Freyarchaeota archaeon]